MTSVHRYDKILHPEEMMRKIAIEVASTNDSLLMLC